MISFTVEGGFPSRNLKSGAGGDARSPERRRFGTPKRLLRSMKRRLYPKRFKPHLNYSATSEENIAGDRQLYTYEHPQVTHIRIGQPNSQELPNIPGQKTLPQSNGQKIFSEHIIHEGLPPGVTAETMSEISVTTPTELHQYDNIAQAKTMPSRPPLAPQTPPAPPSQKKQPLPQNQKSFAPKIAHSPNFYDNSSPISAQTWDPPTHGVEGHGIFGSPRSSPPEANYPGSHPYEASQFSRRARGPARRRRKPRARRARLAIPDYSRYNFDTRPVTSPSGANTWHEQSHLNHDMPYLGGAIRTTPTPREINEAMILQSLQNLGVFDFNYNSKGTNMTPRRKYPAYTQTTPRKRRRPVAQTQTTPRSPFNTSRSSSPYNCKSPHRYAQDSYRQQPQQYPSDYYYPPPPPSPRQQPPPPRHHKKEPKHFPKYSRKPESQKSTAPDDEDSLSASDVSKILKGKKKSNVPIYINCECKHPEPAETDAAGSMEKQGSTSDLGSRSSGSPRKTKTTFLEPEGMSKSRSSTKSSRSSAKKSTQTRDSRSKSSQKSISKKSRSSKSKSKSRSKSRSDEELDESTGSDEDSEEEEEEEGEESDSRSKSRSKHGSKSKSKQGSSKSSKLKSKKSSRLSSKKSKSDSKLSKRSASRGASKSKSSKTPEGSKDKSKSGQKSRATQDSELLRPKSGKRSSTGRASDVLWRGESDGGMKVSRKDRSRLESKRKEGSKERGRSNDRRSGSQARSLSDSDEGDAGNLSQLLSAERKKTNGETLKPSGSTTKGSKSQDRRDKKSGLESIAELSKNRSRFSRSDSRSRSRGASGRDNRPSRDPRDERYSRSRSKGKPMRITFSKKLISL